MAASTASTSEAAQGTAADTYIATTLNRWIGVPSVACLPIEPPSIPATPGELWLADVLAVPKKKRPVPPKRSRTSRPQPRRRRKASRWVPPVESRPWSQSEVDYVSGRLSRAVIAAASAFTPMAFLASLNELRVEKGLTYERFGRRADPRLRISRSSAHAMLTRKRLPSQSQLRAFLHVCEVSPREHDQWLQEHARIARFGPPHGEVRVHRRPAGGLPTPERATSATSAPAQTWPKLPSRQRGRRQRNALWNGAGWLSGVVSATSTIAIILAALNVPTTTIQTVLVIMSGCITGWIMGLVAPREQLHRNQYMVVGFDNGIDDHQPYAPEVIGR